MFVPAGSQHHNGLPEAMVKVMKTSLSQSLNPGVVLAYDELVTLLARISCSMNSRPLGLANTSYSDQQEDILLPITPNHMLMGSQVLSHPLWNIPNVRSLAKDWLMLMLLSRTGGQGGSRQSCPHCCLFRSGRKRRRIYL